MIPLKQTSNTDVEVVAGIEPDQIHLSPTKPYSEDAISLLSKISSILLKDKTARKYPDVISFAFWCRKSNLIRLKKNFKSSHHCLGRGIVLHIAPSNVPVNFAFSLAFGLLSGNSNIVRLPTKKFDQQNIICKVLGEVWNAEEFKSFKSKNSIVRYSIDDKITASISSNCDARLIWGGDLTVNKIRSFPVKPRAVDLCFADRYSICVLDADSIILSEHKSLQRLLNGFFNDTFLFDQDGCSSPHLVVWQGSLDKVDKAKNIFWNNLQSFVKNKHSFVSTHFVDKYMHLTRLALSKEKFSWVKNIDNSIYRLTLNELPANLVEMRGRNGFFFEINDNKLEKVLAILNDKYQTMTYFGVDPDILTGYVVGTGATGIDRIVPVGQAMDMDVFWDGFDIVKIISRVITQR